MGRLEEGIIQFKQTLELDPLSLIANSALGWSYNYARRYEEAIEQFIRAFELDKDFMLTHFWLGHSYIGLSKFSKAIDCFQKAHELSGGSTITLAALGHSYALINEKVKARRILTKFDELSRKKYIDSYLRAKIYIGLADLDRTFEWLQKAYDERSHDLVFLIVDPHLDPLRSDPRYRDLVNKMALNQ